MLYGPVSFTQKLQERLRGANKLYLPSADKRKKTVFQKKSHCRFLWGGGWQETETSPTPLLLGLPRNIHVMLPPIGMGQASQL